MVPVHHCFTATFVTVIYRFAHRHFTGPVLVNCYPSGISQHNYITLPVSYMYWPGVGLAKAQYRIYCGHAIGQELFNQCQGNEHVPLRATYQYCKLLLNQETLIIIMQRTHLLTIFIPIPLPPFQVAKTGPWWSYSQ